MYMNAFPYYLMVLPYMSLILPFIFMIFRCISKYVLYPNVDDGIAINFNSTLVVLHVLQCNLMIFAYIQLHSLLFSYIFPIFFMKQYIIIKCFNANFNMRHKDIFRKSLVYWVQAISMYKIYFNGMQFLYFEFPTLTFYIITSCMDNCAI